MLYLFALLLAWTAAAIGWGGLVVWLGKWLKVEKPFAFDALEPVVGLVILTSLANLLNFFVPLGQYLNLFILLMGWGLAIWRLSLDPSILKQPFWIVLGIVWVGAVSTHAGWRAYHSDSALYHIPAMRWLATSEIPFGLGNLHGRLAYNSAWFSLSVLFSQSVAPYTVNFAGLASEVLLVVFGLLVLHAGHEILSKRGKVGIAPIFLVTAALVGFAPLIRENLSSPSTDHPTLLLILITVYLALRTISRNNPRLFDYDLWLLFLISSFAVTVKVSAIALFLIPIALFLLRYWREIRTKTTLLYSSILASALVLGPWLVRSVILSGCLVYPVNITCVASLPWSIPTAKVLDEANWIASWARAPRQRPEQVLGNWNWLGPWFTRLTQSLDLILPLICLGVGLGLILIAWRQILPRIRNNPIWVIMAAIVVGIVYWFLTAPDLRFGIGWFWALSLLVLSIGILALSRMRGMNLVLVAAALVLIVAGGGSIYDKGSFVLFARHLSLESFLNIVPTIPAAKIVTQKTKQGIPIQIATDTNCWWTEMCTPYFDADLVIRKAPDGRYFFSSPR